MGLLSLGDGGVSILLSLVIIYFTIQFIKYKSVKKDRIWKEKVDKNLESITKRLDQCVEKNKDDEGNKHILTKEGALKKIKERGFVVRKPQHNNIVSSYEREVNRLCNKEMKYSRRKMY